MKSKITTKHALFSGVMSLFLCVAMLIGSTFAWFTDTASTKVNSIQAGTLDVQLLDESGNSLEGKVLSWQKAAGHENEAVLWEPGCTYKLQPIVIKNNGNLALKYKIEITGIKGDAMLNEVIDWTISDTDLGDDHSLAAGKESEALTISGTMKTDADNKYQGLSIDGIAITVLATQDTVEYDSTTKDYDADAEYPTTVESAEALETALAAGENVFLSSDIVLTKQLTIKNDVEIIGNGYSVISEQPVSVDSNANVTMKDVNFATPTNSKNNASSVYASNLKGKVVFDGCTFTNPQWECIQITPKNGAEVIVTNCTFIVDGNGTYAHGNMVERMLHVQNVDETGDFTITVTNNKLIGVDKVRNSVIDIDDIAAFENVTCGGNTFFNHDNTAVSSLEDGKIYVNLAFKYDSASVATNTYTQFTQTPPAALHH